jgi:hypothetical protein
MQKDQHSFLEPIVYHPVGFFDLPIRLRVHDGGKIKLDAHAFTVIFEFLGCKYFTIIRDDVVLYSKAKYY